MKELKYSFINVENCNFCGSIEFKKKGVRLNGRQGFRPSRKTGVTISVMKCKKCGLVFPNPLPIPESIQDNYNVSPDQYWHDDYFEINDTYFQSEISDLKRLIKIGSTAVALDIGAGVGKCMIALINSGFETYGIEPSESFYKMAIEKMGIQADNLQQISIEDAHFDTAFFDFINFGVVLEHLYDPAKSIIKALTWLKPGGIIHIEVPNAKWLINKMLNLTYKVRGMEYIGNLSPMHPPYHLYEFTLKSFIELSKNNADFEIVHHQYYTCETYLPSIFNSVLKPIMRKSKTGMQLEVWLKKKM